MNEHDASMIDEISDANMNSIAWEFARHELEMGWATYTDIVPNAPWEMTEADLEWFCDEICGAPSNGLVRQIEAMVRDLLNEALAESCDNNEVVAR